MNDKMGNKNGFFGIDPSDLSTVKLHQYLLAAIAPRPIAFVSTRNKEGNVNLSPFSYFNIFGANPPLLIFSPARRVRDNTIKHTLENVIKHPEAVVNMVDFSMVEQMSLASTEYEAGVNEFIKAGFTQIPSDNVQVPRVGEAPVSFECKVIKVEETGTEGGAGNLVYCEVVKMHIRESLLDENNMIDPLKLDLVGRMGGSWYSRSNEENMFEIPKPLKTKGIGVDQLPEHVRWSKVLSANNLGRLGNMESIPTTSEIEECRHAFNEKILEEMDNEKAILLIHEKARKLIEAGNTQKAMAWLWLGNRF